MNTALQERKTRVKVNFMIDNDLMAQIRNLIPDGDRSDFANEAFQEALSTFKRKKAFQNIQKFRKKVKLRISMEEFRQLRAYGRE